MATDDWEQIGTFQRQFIVDGENFPGMTGFNLSVSDGSTLSITLGQGIDPSAWLASLPTGILQDPALGSVEAITEECSSPVAVGP